MTSLEEAQAVIANLVARDDCQRIARRFITEAIAEWDEIGDGCFAEWIKLAVAIKWRELAEVSDIDNYYHLEGLTNASRG